MFKIIITSLIFLLIISLSSTSQSVNNTKKIVVISNKCYDYMKCINFDAKLYSSFDKNSNVKLKKFYLNCHSDCNEGEFKSRFDLIWKKVLIEDSEYLIIYGDAIWNTFREEIISYSKTHKVGLFRIFNTNVGKDQFAKLKNDNVNMFIEEYSIDVRNMINYFLSNGKDFRTFYILRDSCEYNLKVVNEIANELKQININYNIIVEEILSGHHLKTFISKLQTERQAVILPVMENVYDNSGGYLNLNEILKVINIHNKKHIEVSLTHDASKYLALSFTDSLCNYSDVNINENNGISKFLNGFDGKSLEFHYNHSYAILNENEMSKLFNGKHLLKRTSDFIDIFR